MASRTVSNTSLYAFPKTAVPSARMLKEKNVVVMESCDGTALCNALHEGKNVVLFGTGPFASVDVSWQISFSGHTNGHLATVIADHPLMEDFLHNGYCGRQFEHIRTLAEEPDSGICIRRNIPVCTDMQFAVLCKASPVAV